MEGLGKYCYYHPYDREKAAFSEKWQLREDPRMSRGLAAGMWRKQA